MIAAVRFQNFKVLRSAELRFEPFNLLLGPNGSGKTSLIQALLRLRTLAAQSASHTHALAHPRDRAPQLEFTFHAPYEGVHLRAACARDDLTCDTLIVSHPPGDAGELLWADLRKRLLTIRGYAFDHHAMGQPSPAGGGAELAPNAGNLSPVLAGWRQTAPAALAALEGEFRRIVPEFRQLDFRETPEGCQLLARVAGNGEVVPADSLSQGTLSLLGILTLAFMPEPPRLVCLEEADRGVHPRALREVRDALYRLSYPQDCGMARERVQVIATTHSPYFLDLYKHHPEEIVFATKQGRAATFERLSERKDLVELLQDAHLGDLWYSGILGGVPGEEL